MKTVNAGKAERNEGNKGNIRIFMVRHAQTPDNVDKALPYQVDGTTFFSKGLVISGHNGVGLTDEGKRQCTAGGQQLARRLQDTGITESSQLSLLCSDLPRTRQTLDGFVAAMPGFGLHIATADYRAELRERDAGDWQGQLREKALGEDPSIERAFTDASYRYRGGESLIDCGTRAGSLLAARAAASRTTTLVVVSHEITILGALEFLEHGEVTNRAWERKGLVKNAGFFDLTFNPSTRRGRVTFSSAE